MTYAVAIILSLFLFTQNVRANISCDGNVDAITSTAAWSSFVTQSAFTVMYYTKSTGNDRGGGNDCSDSTAIVVGNENYDVMFIGRGWTNGEQLCFTYSGVTTPNIELNGAMSPGWHHNAVRLLSGTLTLFVDGVSVASAGSAENLTANLTDFVQFCQAGGGATEDRFMDAKIYNVGVSDAEIKRLGTSKMRTYDRTTPTAYWTFEQCPSGGNGHGVVFADRSGNGRTITGNNVNGSGLACAGNEFISYPMGIQ